MDAVIIANGEIQSSSLLRELWERADLRIAANGGARNAREAGLGQVEILIGDLDSLDAETVNWLEASSPEWIRYPRPKDQTDLELALELALSRGAGQVTILGALGGRVDQMLANMLLLTRDPRLRIMDTVTEAWVPRLETEIIGQEGDTVSLIPLSETVDDIETKGLVYPLHHESLSRSTTRGVSNIMSAARASIRFESGCLLVLHLRVAGA